MANVRRLSVAAVVTYIAVFGAGAAVLLAPLDANGVSGCALIPSYHDFAVTTFRPLSRQVTLAELRRAGVPIPTDAVAHRRDLAAWFLVGADAVGGITAALFIAARRHAVT